MKFSVSIMECRKIIAGVVILLLCIDVCAGRIRCYVCTTQNGPLAGRCGDDFRLTTLDASYCYGSCRKTRGFRDEGGRRVAEVTRGCVPPTDEGCTDGSHNGISAKICYCNDEFCNTAPGMGVSSVAMLLPTLVWVLWKLMWR